MHAPIHEYKTREALAEALATGVAAILAGGIATRGSASLAVSGGSTPKLFFDVLSNADIDWPRVTVTLVDERWVPETNERSNAALAKAHLLKNKAASAQFQPLYVPADTPEEMEDELSARFQTIGRPFDAVILGMGPDGHTASFFPKAERLAEAIDPGCAKSVMAIRAPGAGEPRITLTLPQLLDARFLALHIEGDEKKSVLHTALQPGSALDLPIRAVLEGQRTRPIEIFWSP